MIKLFILWVIAIIALNHKTNNDTTRITAIWMKYYMFVIVVNGRGLGIGERKFYFPNA
jgi:hypothetical protein